MPAAALATAAPPARGLGAYLAGLRDITLLKPDEERELGRRSQAGDVAARQELIARNLRFVVQQAKQLRPAGVAMDEIIAEGNVGLARAARDFDPGKGVRFTTYAAWWIREAIQRYLAAQCGTLRIPEKKHRLVRRAEAARARLRSETGAEPDDAAIAAACRTSRDELRRVRAASRRASRLVPELKAKAMQYGDPTNVEERFAHRGRCKDLVRLMAGLPRKERDAIRLYFGLGGGEPRTFQQIGAIVGLGKEGTRVAFHRGMKKLRALAAAMGEGLVH